MIATVEIPISWLGPVILAVTPTIPPIMLITGILILRACRGDNSDIMIGVFGAWLTIMGALGCLVEIFHYGVVRFV